MQQQQVGIGHVQRPALVPESMSLCPALTGVLYGRFVQQGMVLNRRCNRIP